MMNSTRAENVVLEDVSLKKKCVYERTSLIANEIGIEELSENLAVIPQSSTRSHQCELSEEISHA